MYKAGGNRVRIGAIFSFMLSIKPDFGLGNCLSPGLSPTLKWVTSMVMVGRSVINQCLSRGAKGWAACIDMCGLPMVYSTVGPGRLVGGGHRTTALTVRTGVWDGSGIGWQ